MKKIIATVLAMVMALALCTTAFAATKTDEIEKTGYTLMDMSNANVTMTADKFTKTVTDAQVVTSGSKTTTTYYADEYVIDTVHYWACDAAIASHKLVKGGTVVFLISQDEATKIGANFAKGTDKVASAFVEAKKVADQKCGDITADAYTIEGKNYVAGGSNLAVLNGKFVAYGTESSTVPHAFTKAEAKKDGYFTTDTKGIVNTVKCDTCEKFFNVVDKVDKTYTGSVVSTTAFNYGTVTVRYILTGTATATPDSGTSTTTKPSPKTFDAGIAMYVGMALTSVAGSAVVIGKKKEF